MLTRSSLFMHPHDVSLTDLNEFGITRDFCPRDEVVKAWSWPLTSI